MKSYSSTLDTPIGPFTIVMNADDEVLASGWTDDVTALTALIHPDLRGVLEPKRDLGAATRAAKAYHRGDLTAPDGIEVNQRGGGFITQAWTTLRKVPAGEPVSYTELAARTGNPSANRAAAMACARNAAALFVPCHRVLRADGTLGGFRWGLPAKRWLLEHEANS